MESRIIIVSKHLRHILFTITTVCFFVCCSKQKEHTAPAIHERDSASIMTSYGVNTLISDSGVIKYRIVTERWEVNEISFHTMRHGLLFHRTKALGTKRTCKSAYKGRVTLF